jgi:hypothetical protein
VVRAYSQFLRKSSMIRLMVPTCDRYDAHSMVDHEIDPLLVADQPYPARHGRRVPPGGRCKRCWMHAPTAPFPDQSVETARITQ